MRLPSTATVLLFAFAPLSGCKAEVSASADVRTGSDKETADFDRPLEAPELREAQRVSSAQEQGEPALLGARQDLSYAGPSQAVCSCLAVAVGQPDSSSFKWAGSPPTVSSQSQLVIALTSNGVACADAAAKGASYWGHEIVGDDVVVTVENAAGGRPLAQGAVIPRPLGSGQVYVSPAGKGVPYGKPLDGSGKRCQVSKLVAATAPQAAPSPGGGTRIRTEEADPSSTRVEIP